MEADDIQYLLSISFLPFSFKIFYGLILDTCTIGQSRYKLFIFIFALLQILATQFLFWIEIPEKYKIWNIVMLFIINSCNAINDLAISIMII